MLQISCKTRTDNDQDAISTLNVEIALCEVTKARLLHTEYESLDAPTRHCVCPDLSHLKQAIDNLSRFDGEQGIVVKIARDGRLVLSARGSSMASARIVFHTRNQADRHAARMRGGGARGSGSGGDGSFGGAEGTQAQHLRRSDRGARDANEDDDDGSSANQGRSNDPSHVRGNKARAGTGAAGSSSSSDSNSEDNADGTGDYLSSRGRVRLDAKKLVKVLNGAKHLTGVFENFKVGILRDGLVLYASFESLGFSCVVKKIHDVHS